MKSFVSMAVLALTAWWIFHYLSSHRELLDSLFAVSSAQLLVLVVLRTLFTGTYGLFLKAFTLKFDVRLNTREWFGLPFLTTLGNQLTPFAGGVILRAIYLKHRHSLPYATFTTLLVANHLIIIGVAGLAGLLTCVLSGGFAPSRLPLTVFFSLVVGVVALVVLVPPYIFRGGNFIVRAVNDVLAGWSCIMKDRTLLIMVLVFAVLGVLLNGLTFWLAYGFLDIAASPWSVVMVSLLPFFLVLFYLTPGNLGVQEIAIGLASGMVGPGVGNGLVAALLVRTATLIPVFVLGSVFGVLLFKDLGWPGTGSPDDEENGSP